MHTPTPTTRAEGGDLILGVEHNGVRLKEFFLQHGMDFGRASSSTVYIDDPAVDLIHAEVILHTDNHYWLCCKKDSEPVTDLSDSSAKKSSVQLKHGTVIQLGHTVLRIYSPRNENTDRWANQCPVCLLEIAAQQHHQIRCKGCESELLLLSHKGLVAWLPRRLGQFKLVNYVASGGVGHVFLAVDSRTNESVAVKVLKPELCETDAWQRSMRKEATIMQSFDSPCLIGFRGSGKVGQLHWVATEWIDGHSLADQLKLMKNNDEQHTLNEISHFMRPISGGLQQLHQAGLIHHDMKPSNVLITQSGQAKLSDFSITRTDPKNSSTVTTALTAAGTGPYMAPERWQNAPVTPAVDIYALGIIWHELLLLKRPKRKISIGKKRPDCPPVWEHLITQCLEDKPENRPSLPMIDQHLYSF